MYYGSGKGGASSLLLPRLFRHRRAVKFMEDHAKDIAQTHGQDAILFQLIEFSPVLFLGADALFPVDTAPLLPIRSSLRELPFPRLNLPQRRFRIFLSLLGDGDSFISAGARYDL